MAPALIRDRDLDLERVPTGLLKLAHDSLGSAGAPEDGHPAVFFEAANQFNVGAARVAELVPLLNAHMKIAHDATSDTLVEERAQLARDVEKGKRFLGEGPAVVAEAAKNPVQPLTSTPPAHAGASDSIRRLTDRPQKG